jgi:hypothetical protein
VPDATNLTNFYIKHNPTNDRNGFTGQSKNWETSSIEFPCLAIKRPWKVYVRFNFFADSIAMPGEGWMIDDINISGYGELNENDETPTIDIYTNPNYGENVRLGTAWDMDVSDKLYGVNGQLSKLGTLAAFEKTIFLQNIQSGFYSLHFYDNQNPLGTAKFRQW